MDYSCTDDLRTLLHDSDHMQKLAVEQQSAQQISFKVSWLLNFKGLCVKAMRACVQEQCKHSNLVNIGGVLIATFEGK